MLRGKKLQLMMHHHPLDFGLAWCATTTATTLLLSGLIIVSVTNGFPFDFESNSIAISCGSSANLTAHNGRLWVGDDTFSLTGKSWASRAEHKASVLIDPVPYQTARASTREFSFIFSVEPGQKFIRLHFNPAPYHGFKKSTALFTVKTGPYTLLRSFSPPVAADALGVKILHKEFCVNVQESERLLTVTFTPEDAHYAFVNGIEIVSMLVGLYFTPEGDLGPHVVGHKHRFYVDNATALEMVQRLNVGGHSISSTEDVSMFRNWEDDYGHLLIGGGGGGGGVGSSIETAMKIRYPEIIQQKTHVAPLGIYQTARTTGAHPGKQWKMNDEHSSITWRVPVDLGFRYLVRLHFCEFDPEISARGERQFGILINNQIAEDKADVIKWSGASGIAVYRDYIAMVGGDRVKGKGNLFISLQPSSDELGCKRRDGILNGLEIFKLSNPDNSLAGATQRSIPNRIPETQEGVWFDRKNEIATAFTAAIVLLNIAIYHLRRLSQGNSTMGNGEEPSSEGQTCRQFSLEQILLSTNSFSPDSLIGAGGYGKVYKGCLDGGKTVVAIKRLKEGSRQGENEFWTEIKMLSKARNEHLVSLIGFCNEGKEMVLVYEYMPRGTLEDHLHKIRNHPLSWERRLEIIIGAARGLHYLHACSHHKVIHRDVKSSNILVDENWVAKISDFGLSKMGPGNESFTHVSTNVKGTFGYIDPEYFLTRRLTTKSDVYSFGVVLLEVLTGRPALDKKLVLGQKSLATWAADFMKEKGKCHEIVDARLAGQVSRTCLKEFVKIAGRCLHRHPNKRPDMDHVVTSLELVLALQQKEKEDEKITSIDSADRSSDGSISFNSLSERLSEESAMEKDTAKRGAPNKGKDNDKSRHKMKKDRSSTKNNGSVKWWDFLWSSPKQSSRTKPRIPKQPPSKGNADPSTQLQGGLFCFSPQDILQATDNFSHTRVVGFVGKEVAYIGYMNGCESAVVAIRRPTTAQSAGSMAHELQLKLDNLPLPSHANVVSLIGYCEGPTLMLVYNYMANGSLHDHLYGSPDKKDPLPWNQKLKICIDAGRGLSYLQPTLKQSNLHWVFNSTHILLDENWVARVSEISWTRNKESREKFTFESDYCARGDPTSTEKFYVYQFGLLLIRALCVCSQSNMDGESLARWFKSHISAGVIDCNAVERLSPECIKILDIAGSCLHDQGSKRPTLSEIVTSLEAVLYLQQ